jgi:hypothetical protein
MDQMEAYEFFMEVKNKEIQELKDKLERTNASCNAMINAGIKNRKRLTEIGDEMAEFMTMEIDTPHELIPKRNFIVNSWDAAKKGRNP